MVAKKKVVVAWWLFKYFRPKSTICSCYMGSTRYARGMSGSGSILCLRL
jgi:hypothetical protein